MNKNYEDGIIKSIPKKWTKEEIKLLKEMKQCNFSNKHIAEKLERTETSISIKFKRLGKTNKTYNKKHINKKRQLNLSFLEFIKPNSVLDVYSGEDSFYNNVVSKDRPKFDLTTNDSNKSFNCNYNLDALKLCCLLYYEGKKYDIIDLDPFGSSFDCFDLAIKMAKKGLIITLGELGHKRWKRLDFVRRYYGINYFENFTTENLIKEIKKIGLRNKKELIVKHIGEWNRISRVYFEIKEIKIKEQWISSETSQSKKEKK